MSKPSALVVGDIVLDCNLYGGTRTNAASQERATLDKPHRGGAALSCELLKAAADLAGLKWDAEQPAAPKVPSSRPVHAAAPGPVPPPPRPDPIHDIHLGTVSPALGPNPPKQLTWHRVWALYPAKKGAKDRADDVWRARELLGYGVADKPEPTPVLGLAPGLPTDPAVILVDDGGLQFRTPESQVAWPAASAAKTAPFVVLKMSAPLCRGAYWRKLIGSSGAADRLLVVVAAEDLRRVGAQVRQHLSWEQCATAAMRALHTDPVAGELLKAAHVVVNFGSAGALWLHRKNKAAGHTAELIFDPVLLEGHFGRGFGGTVYGFQACLAVAVAHHVLVAGEARRKELDGKGLPADEVAEKVLSAVGEKGVPTGIISGLVVRRKLRELGHGKATDTVPGFPVKAIARVVADRHTGFARVAVPAASALEDSDEACPWTILAASRMPDRGGSPHVELAQLVAVHGRGALSEVPSLTMGKLFTVDRTEIESLRTLGRLIEMYEQGPVQKRPLSIGIFGAPGSGKSFAVKELAKSVLPDKAPFLEFNLSQFKNPDELVGAFHRVRDEVLKGVTPVVFWDEFDSQEYKWLQYLLAPMQDGAFQQGEVTHPIGKCVFLFAGGTAETIETFGAPPPDPKGGRNLTGDARADWLRDEAAHRTFKMLKGPDFVSRLHDHLNVLGVNPRPQAAAWCEDQSWPLRRALVLRSFLGLEEEPNKASVLRADEGLLFALLDVPRYEHGSRSFEKVLNALKEDRQDGRLHRSALPPDPLLDRDTSAAELHLRIDRRNAYKTYPDLEKIAAEIHADFRRDAPLNGWTLNVDVDKPYAQLTADYQTANREAARRIPGLLFLIGFKIVPIDPANVWWGARLAEEIGKHREFLAQAEHLGWNAERFDAGWTYAAKRDNARKHHHLLVDWVMLSEADKDKDRVKMDKLPALLKGAGYMAVPMPAE